jgi:hypothetical protein
MKHCSGETHGLPTYGSYLAAYRGDGVLTLQDGQTLPCRFEAGQLVTGEVFLLCAVDRAPSPWPGAPFLRASRFNGLTSDGHKLSADAGLFETNYLPDIPRGDPSPLYAAFSAQELRVQLVAGARPATARYGLANFCFTGPHPTAAALPLELRGPDGPTQLVIHRLPDYRKIKVRLQTLKGIEVTSEVVVDMPPGGDPTPLDRVVNDLCYLLSVARGAKIQWLYQDHYNTTGTRITRVHREHVAKPYGPLAVIDPRDWGADETKTFVERAFHTYAARREPFLLDKGVIDAYLDAKAEGDYLQMRGVKVAVALEMLKDAFVQQPGITDRVIDEAVFVQLLPTVQAAIAAALQHPVVSRDQVQAIINKAGSLNWRSLRAVVSKLCRQIQFRPSNDELDLFIRCRNSLVHQGEFYCLSATPAERQDRAPLPTPAAEYFFLVNVLDRIFLRLLDYDGTYVDHRIPGDPVRRRLSERHWPHPLQPDLIATAV